MTTRAIPGALDPLSSSSLNKLHETQPPTKKRKIGTDIAAGQLSTTSIVIRVGNFAGSVCANRRKNSPVNHLFVDSSRLMPRPYPMNR